MSGARIESQLEQGPGMVRNNSKTVVASSAVFEPAQDESERVGPVAHPSMEGVTVPTFHRDDDPHRGTGVVGNESDCAVVAGPSMKGHGAMTAIAPQQVPSTSVGSSRASCYQCNSDDRDTSHAWKQCSPSHNGDSHDRAVRRVERGRGCPDSSSFRWGRRRFRHQGLSEDQPPTLELTPSNRDASAHPLVTRLLLTHGNIPRPALRLGRDVRSRRVTGVTVVASAVISSPSRRTSVAGSRGSR